MDDWCRLKSFDNLGIVGENATIVPADGYTNPPLFAFGDYENAYDLRIEGLRFDFRHPETGPSPIYALLHDGLEIRDIVVDGSSQKVRFVIYNDNGIGRVQGLQMRGGALQGTFSTGCYIGKYNRGNLSLVDCHISGYLDNGLYASNSRGQIRVVGGSYNHNGISNVRVSNGDIVRDVNITCDTTDSAYKNQRGIWVKGPDAEIDNCDIRFQRVTESDGAIVLDNGTSVHHTTIEVHSNNVAAIRGFIPLENSNRGISACRFENVSIQGSANRGPAISIYNFDRCVFDGVTVHQSGSNRIGVRLSNVDDCTIRDSLIDVTGTPIEAQNSTVETPDTTTRKGGETGG